MELCPLRFRQQLFPRRQRAATDQGEDAGIDVARHLDDAVDLPHLRNAIAQIPKAKIEGFGADDMTKLQEKAKKLLDKINADSKTSAAHFLTEEETMNEKLLALLGLKVGATVEEAIAALSSLKTEQEKLSSELATARAQSVPSMDKFIPRADYDVAIARAQAAEKLVEDNKQDALKKAVGVEIESALKAGKITPATKDYYVSQCSSQEGLEEFKKFCSAAPVIAGDSNLDKKDPPRNEEKVFSDLELDVATKCGITKEKLIAIGR